MLSSLTHLSTIIFLLILVVVLPFFALDRGFLRLRFAEVFFQLYSCRSSSVTVGRVIFLMGSQCTQTQWIWVYSHLMDITWKSIPYLARDPDPESVPHLYSMNKFIKNQKPPLKSFQTNAYLKSLNASMEPKKEVHVLLSQNTGLTY